MGCVYKASSIKNWDVATEIDGNWIPARPLNSFHTPCFGRIRAAWNVLIGKFDALNWEN